MSSEPLMIFKKPSYPINPLLLDYLERFDRISSDLRSLYQRRDGLSCLDFGRVRPGRLVLQRQHTVVVGGGNACLAPSIKLDIPE